MTTNDTRCTREIKSRTAKARIAFNRKKTLLTSKLDLILGRKLEKSYIWNTDFYVADILTLQRGGQKYLRCFEMWCRRRMEKINWTDHVRNEEILYTVKDKRNILHTIKRRKANSIGHIWRRNCLLKQII
jgi:hypothetical protein